MFYARGNKVLQELSLCWIKDLGLIEYDEAYRMQKEAVERVLTQEKEIIYLCEHPTVFTMGRLADEHNLLISLDEIKENKFQYKKIDRGGDITLHSLGQLVVYPIFNLQNKGKSLKVYLNKLEGVAIDLLKGFDIVATRFPQKTGVWVGDKKIASIGIGVRRWISYHGMAINVNTDLSLFKKIRPCGLDVEMTSISRIKNQSIDLQEVKNKIIPLLSKTFNLSILE